MHSTIIVSLLAGLVVTMELKYDDSQERAIKLHEEIKNFSQLYSERCQGYANGDERSNYTLEECRKIKTDINAKATVLTEQAKKIRKSLNPENLSPFDYPSELILLTNEIITKISENQCLNGNSGLDAKTCTALNDEFDAIKKFNGIYLHNSQHGFETTPRKPQQ